MKRFVFKGMKGGWFVGDFSPSAFRTKSAEVSFKTHPKGEAWETHYHKVGTEINLIVRGKLNINNVFFQAGDIFVIEPGEIAKPKFLEDCEMVVVKVPSVPNDKYVV